MKFFRKLENEWSIGWTVDLNYIAAVILHVDTNVVIVISTDGVVDKFYEEKSIVTLNSVSSLNR